MRSSPSIRHLLLLIALCTGAALMHGCSGFNDQVLPPEHRFSIIGRIVGNGIMPDSVLITIPQLARQTTTDASGWFVFKDIPTGSYTLIPSKGAWTFAPSSLGILIRNGDDSSARFSAEPSIIMVTIPGGTFRMGTDDPSYPVEEHPEHEVTISPFMIGQYEVTQRQWTRIMGENPSTFTGDNNPVESVSWYDAVRFCNELSRRENLDTAYVIDGTVATLNINATGYRLPTEAEWEHACRAGTTTTYYNGGKSSDLDLTAWHKGNAASRTHTVGQLDSNPFGLYDMLGNVIEWCWDWAGNSYPPQPQTDPTGVPSGTMKIVRGGSWGVDSTHHRTTFRMRYTPGTRLNSVGFRVARSIK